MASNDLHMVERSSKTHNKKTFPKGENDKFSRNARKAPKVKANNRQWNEFDEDEDR